LPLIIQLAPAGGPPHVTGSWITEGGQTLAHCIFGESTYSNRDGDQKRLARSILAAHNAIILIPREPLRSGSSYRAVVDVNGLQIDWTFSVDF